MDSASVAFSASSLLGPVGGLIGIAFGAGATAGWGFANRTIYKVVTREREECAKRVAVLEGQNRDMSERYISSLENQLGQARQLGQVRQSTHDLGIKPRGMSEGGET